MGMALLAFLNHWLKHETHEDLLAAIKTLQVANIKMEYTDEDSESTIIHDITVLVACYTPILIFEGVVWHLQRGSLDHCKHQINREQPIQVPRLHLRICS